MEQLKRKSFKILEFDKILEKLSSYTESESVKKRIIELEPFTNVAAAKEALGDKLAGTIVKEIYVPGRIVNIVVKP